MKKMIKKLSLLCVLITSFGYAQKVIVEGDGSSLMAQMEFYARQTKDVGLKAQYFSYAETDEWSDFSAAQFKSIYETQLKKMYIVMDGQLTQIKKWHYHHPIVAAIAPKARLVEIEGVGAKIPKKYRVEIRSVLGAGNYIANVSEDNGYVGRNYVVQFGENATSYTKGTVLDAYLLRTDFTEALRDSVRGMIVGGVYKLVPDEMGDSIHPPTLKEMANAIKGGLKPKVLAPVGRKPCTTCEGSGVDKAKLAAAEAAADREATAALGKREDVYDVLGRRTTHRQTLRGDSKAFTAAKLRRNKPKCQSCGGDGYVNYDLFRILVR
ncbi:MAG: hypothetical protein IJV69_00120 [Kiritimatiellae bacterium]|nr:hypothetical protein [Kiritimatiellia bacterium]